MTSETTHFQDRIFERYGIRLGMRKQLEITKRVMNGDGDFLFRNNHCTYWNVKIGRHLVTVVYDELKKHLVTAIPLIRPDENGNYRMPKNAVLPVNFMIRKFVRRESNRSLKVCYDAYDKEMRLIARLVTAATAGGVERTVATITVASNSGFAAIQKAIAYWDGRVTSIQLANSAFTVETHENKDVNHAGEIRRNQRSSNASVAGSA